MSKAPKGAAPRAYDIVWTRFPEDEFGRPGPKPRPSLVLGVFQDEDGILLELAPGTTNLKHDRRPFDFFVTNWVEMQHAGLPKATRFDLDDIVPIPYETAYFRPYRQGGKSSPIMGCLSPQSVIALQQLLGWRDHLAREQDDDAPDD